MSFWTPGSLGLGFFGAGTPGGGGGEGPPPAPEGSIFSLSKEVESYTGQAIRVQRASDGTEQDIGFSGTNLDTSALMAFADGGTVYVTRYYDQAELLDGVGFDYEFKRPVIVRNGLLETNSAGEPSIKLPYGAYLELPVTLEVMT